MKYFAAFVVSAALRLAGVIAIGFGAYLALTMEGSGKKADAMIQTAMVGALLLSGLVLLGFGEVVAMLRESALLSTRTAQASETISGAITSYIANQRASRKYWEE